MNPDQIIPVKNHHGTVSRQPIRSFRCSFRAVSGSDVIKEGTIIEVNITTADGRSFSTNVRLTPEDMQLFSDVKDTVK